jgi:hypothetical protein
MSSLDHEEKDEIFHQQVCRSKLEGAKTGQGKKS